MFKKPEITNLTLDNFKDKLKAAAQQAGGVWENFGQEELAKLKDKYKYNGLANQWSPREEWNVKRAIDHLSGWCCQYTLESDKTQRAAQIIHRDK